MSSNDDTQFAPADDQPREESSQEGSSQGDPAQEDPSPDGDRVGRLRRAFAAAFGRDDTNGTGATAGADEPVSFDDESGETLSAVTAVLEGDHVDEADTALLQARDVSLVYPGPIPVHALSDVNLAVAHGERIALIGPSGAGKSSLLNILGLLDTPTSGEYWVSGRPTATATEKERAHLRSTWFGFIFQAFHLLDRRSVLDNVKLGMFFSPIPTSEWDDRAAAALETVGLSHRMHTAARLLSGGERQRAAIARAVVHSPRVLMADEPTGNLDSRNSERILELLASLHQPDGAQIIVTHDEDVAAQMDRAVTVFDGTVTDDATQ